jgi:ketosteroid isomerase-like protein
MEPMKPMKPMEPMKGQEPWWPEDLGQPSTAGSEDDLKYAYFADSHRLAVSRGGEVTIYDTADHEITGVSQKRGSDEGDVSFSGPDGEVSLGSLKVVD